MSQGDGEKPNIRGSRKRNPKKTCLSDLFQILCNLRRRSFCFRLALDGRQTEVPLVYWKNGPTRIGAFGLWSDRDDFFSIQTHCISKPSLTRKHQPSCKNVRLMGQWVSKHHWILRYPICGNKASYWSYVLYIQNKLKHNHTTVFYMPSKKNMNIIEHPYGLWFWSLLTWESFVPIFTIPLLPPRILSEPTSFLTQRNVRRLERCSSHHGRCSRRGAASYGGSSRGSPSAVDVEIEVLSAGR